MKVSELSGAALDWAVAKCEGLTCFGHQLTEDKITIILSDGTYENFEPSCNWQIGGAIIARERISLLDQGGDCWLAICGWKEVFGDTQLEAAMRAYVTSKLGDEIQIPEGVVR